MPFQKGHKLSKGRPSKAEEQQLIEKLSPLQDKAFKALSNALDEEHNWAVKLWFEYMYGKPRETKDLTVISEQPIFNGINLDVPTDNSPE